VTGVHRVIATVHVRDVRPAAMGAAMEFNRAVMIVVPTGIATMEREMADQVAMVNDRVLGATSNRVRTAKTMSRARCARASLARVARTMSAAIRARISARRGLRNRRLRVLLASR